MKGELPPPPHPPPPLVYQSRQFHAVCGDLIISGNLRFAHFTTFFSSSASSSTHGHRRMRQGEGGHCSPPPPKKANVPNSGKIRSKLFSFCGFIFWLFCFCLFVCLLVCLFCFCFLCFFLSFFLSFFMGRGVFLLVEIFCPRKLVGAHVYPYPKVLE